MLFITVAFQFLSFSQQIHFITLNKYLTEWAHYGLAKVAACISFSVGMRVLIWFFMCFLFAFSNGAGFSLFIYDKYLNFYVIICDKKEFCWQWWYLVCMHRNKPFHTLANIQNTIATTHPPCFQIETCPNKRQATM